MRIGPKLEQNAVRAVLLLFTAATVFILLFIVVFILRKGLPVLDFSFLTRNPVDMGRAGGIFSTIVGTLVLTAVAVLIAAPLGVGTAIFLTEYTWENRVTRIIRFGADCLAGIPSIIFGLFGFILFVTKLRFGWSILSGGLTLAFMILPTIIRTSEEAIRAVPAAYREVSFSLGSHPLADGHQGRPAGGPAGDRHGHHPERRAEHRRDGGRHLHGGKRPSHPHVRLLLVADHGGPLLHPGPGRHLDGQRLRDGRGARHLHPRSSTSSPTT